MNQKHHQEKNNGNRIKFCFVLVTSVVDLLSSVFTARGRNSKLKLQHNPPINLERVYLIATGSFILFLFVHRPAAHDDECRKHMSG